MAEPQGDNVKAAGNRPRATLTEVEAATMAAPAAPCGACKFLRRKCVTGCIFAPHFGSNQGAARFAAVHKVFGASNASKLLLHIPIDRHHDAVITITYEAQARLSDPVYGCVSSILALQQQVASLEAELAIVQNQLIHNRLAVENALQQQQVAAVYSNNSSASNNIVNMRSSFTCNFDAETAPSSHHLELLQISQPIQDKEEDDEESHIPAMFTNEVLNGREML